MTELFIISPEFKKRLHPDALKVFYDWAAEVQRQVQLDEITEDDLKVLSNDNRIKFKTSVLRICECLKKCADVREGQKLYDVYVGDLFLERGVISELKRDLALIWCDIQPLLREIHLAKMAKIEDKLKKELEEAKEELEKARQVLREMDEEESQQAVKAEDERKEREEQERRHAAFKAIKVPADASTYLRTPKESDEFASSINEAIDAYLDKGELYLADDRSCNYCWWCSEINRRRDEKQRRNAAKSRASEYNQRLNNEIATLRSSLCPRRRDHSSYFKKEIKDHRYMGEDFTQFLSSEENKAFDNTIVKIATSRLHNLVSNDLCEFVEGKYYRSFFLLPSAVYAFQGVPCLDFIFDVFAVLETRVWLKPRQKTFGGYVFDLPWRQEKGYSVLLQEPEFLGYDYVVLTPEDIGGCSYWQTIPLDLIKSLMKGELQPAGSTIISSSESEKVYRIKHFEGEVTIPKIFENCLKKIGSVERMLSIGIVGQEIANTIKENLGQSVIKQGTGMPHDEQVVVFTDEQLISSLTILGIPRKVAEELCRRVPKNLSLDEAITFALRNQNEVIPSD